MRYWLNSVSTQRRLSAGTREHWLEPRSSMVSGTRKTAVQNECQIVMVSEREENRLKRLGMDALGGLHRLFAADPSSSPPAVEGPPGVAAALVVPGQPALVFCGEAVVGRLCQRLRDQNNSDNEITLFLYEHAPQGDWELSNQCPPTARPGHSNHERGLAIDSINGGQFIRSHDDPAYQWLAAHAGSFGLMNLPSEPWHWSVDGR